VQAIIEAAHHADRLNLSSVFQHDTGDLNASSRSGPDQAEFAG
jgi:hypothetical protein